MQKALNILDVVRFRDYLGEHYKRQDIVDGKPDVLPIINVYILDDRLPFVESNRYETELDRLLTVFEQKNFVDKEIYKDYTHPVEDENIRRIKFSDLYYRLCFP